MSKWEDLPTLPERGWLGHASEFGRDMPVFLEKLGALGPLTRFRIGPQAVLFLNAPGLIYEVFAQQDPILRRDPTLRWIGLLALGQGLLTADGPGRIPQRKLALAGLTASKSASVRPVFQRRADAWTASLRSGEQEISRPLAAWSLSAMMEALFGANSGFDGALVCEHVAGLSAGLRRVLLEPWRLPALLASPKFWSQRKALRDVAQAAARTGRGLLGPALARAAAGDHGPRWRDELSLSLMLAGSESSAAALAWACWELAGDEALQEALSAEASESPAWSALLWEVLRLHPPAWMMGRRVIGELRVGGWRFPKGILVYASQVVLHRHPDFWEEPTVFKPERWQGSRPTGLPRQAYFPFGVGPRSCVGEALAMAMMEPLLQALLRRFRLRRQPGALEPPMLPFITAPPRPPLLLNLTAR